jgi:hypothetical protein
MPQTANLAAGQKRGVAAAPPFIGITYKILKYIDILREPGVARSLLI